ncbi:MAG: hypothetical protein ACT4QA_10255 [Panacagrimonas sp.]
MQARLAQAEKTLAQLVQTAADAADAPTGSLPAEAASPHDLQAEETAREARDDARIALLESTLDRQFHSEPADPRRAQQTKSELISGFNGNGLGGNQISDLRCRSSLCRLDVLSKDAAAHGRLFTGQGQWAVMTDTQTFWRRTERSDGSLSTTMYITRAGSALPTVPW